MADGRHIEKVCGNSLNLMILSTLDRIHKNWYVEVMLPPQ